MADNLDENRTSYTTNRSVENDKQSENPILSTTGMRFGYRLGQANGWPHLLSLIITF